MLNRPPFNHPEDVLIKSMLSIPTMPCIVLEKVSKMVALVKTVFSMQLRHSRTRKAVIYLTVKSSQTA